MFLNVCMIKSLTLIIYGQHKKISEENIFKDYHFCSFYIIEVFLVKIELTYSCLRRKRTFSFLKYGMPKCIKRIYPFILI
jgi:hypothetical protein